MAVGISDRQPRMEESVPQKKLIDRIVFVGAVLPSGVTAIAISHFTLLPFDQSLIIAAGLAVLTWLSWRKFVPGKEA
ncbi:MAG: hypothetical protein O3C21_03050 [Verrucomicrobia bacterium]|nr:hypothetical protein [Verrucomicrobiota bacterium]